jgi:hypothetical protein
MDGRDKRQCLNEDPLEAARDASRTPVSQSNDAAALDDSEIRHEAGRTVELVGELRVYGSLGGFRGTI